MVEEMEGQTMTISPNDVTMIAGVLAIGGAFFAMAIAPRNAFVRLGIVIIVIGLFGAVWQTFTGGRSQWPMAITCLGASVYFVANWLRHEKLTHK